MARRPSEKIIERHQNEFGAAYREQHEPDPPVEPPPPNPFGGYSTASLQAEINRRAAEGARLREERRQKNSVIVYCPSCHGSGNVEYYDQWAGPTTGPCGSCNGSGSITAELR